MPLVKSKAWTITEYTYNNIHALPQDLVGLKNKIKKNQKTKNKKIKKTKNKKIKKLLILHLVMFIGNNYIGLLFSFIGFRLLLHYDNSYSIRSYFIIIFAIMYLLLLFSYWDGLVHYLCFLDYVLDIIIIIIRVKTIYILISCIETLFGYKL
jgi:hypothetical protein